MRNGLFLILPSGESLTPRRVSALERALKNQVSEARILAGRNECPSLLIVDAQRVKNTDTAEEKGGEMSASLEAL